MTHPRGPDRRAQPRSDRRSRAVPVTVRCPDRQAREGRPHLDGDPQALGEPVGEPDEPGAAAGEHHPCHRPVGRCGRVVVQRAADLLDELPGCPAHRCGPSGAIGPVSSARPISRLVCSASISVIPRSSTRAWVTWRPPESRMRTNRGMPFSWTMMLVRSAPMSTTASGRDVQAQTRRRGDRAQDCERVEVHHCGVQPRGHHRVDGADDHLLDTGHEQSAQGPCPVAGADLLEGREVEHRLVGVDGHLVTHQQRQGLAKLVDRSGTEPRPAGRRPAGWPPPPSPSCGRTSRRPRAPRPPR